MDESTIFLNRDIFISIFGQEIKEKAKEHSAMVNIMKEMHVLFIKSYFLSNRSKCAHCCLPESLACNEVVISVISMLVWGDWKVLVLVVF